MVDAMPEAALLTGRNWRQGGGEIYFANRAFCALTGYRRAELAGRNTRLLHGPRTDLAVLRQGGRGAARAELGEGWLYRKEGTPFYAEWSLSPAAGPSVRRLAVYHDVSERKRLQEALLHSHKLDTVGLLASGVAHDFNNLLSVINGYCEILTPQLAGNTPAQQELREIHRAGQKAAAIARQILEFSRRRETEAKVVNFNTLIREISEILRRVVGDGIALELRLASDLGNVRIDPTQFQQILLNLCFNARDAMPGGGRLNIHTANQPPAPAGRRGAAVTPRVVLQVTDTGAGMDAATRRHIFEPFFTTKPSGTGLGLATVHSIVRQHGGEIRVCSRPERGAHFELIFPETPEPEETISTALPAPAATRGTETVLLIEADPVLRKLIGGILSADGYRVMDAADPRAAARFARRSRPPPELLIANLGAAAAGTLAGTLRARNPRLRLINLSALPSGLPAGFSPRAVAHLAKPFALQTLMRTVRSLLDAR
jgi:PAS domain S-box-containing protein